MKKTQTPQLHPLFQNIFQAHFPQFYETLVLKDEEEVKNLPVKEVKHAR